MPPLTNLPHWRRDGASLTRTIESASFPAALALVDRVAETAESMNHHPDTSTSDGALSRTRISPPLRGRDPGSDLELA
ncbi:4a-hydroxytetrahydrobiopterin dehydratase, partial [Rhodococcus hoagii]|nr:4a-hydroxytetrahydrobiopterin dehydratase [Prescottella equi]